MGSGVVLYDVVIGMAWHGMAWWSVLVWYSRNVVCHGLVWRFCCAWILEPWGQLCKIFYRGMACHPLYLLHKYFNFSTFICCAGIPVNLPFTCDKQFVIVWTSPTAWRHLWDGKLHDTNNCSCVRIESNNLKQNIKSMTIYRPSQC